MVPEVVAQEIVAEEDTTPVIENIKRKIEGPKILGKIDLPVDNDTRPKKDEKRKRKRIPLKRKKLSAKAL